MENATIDYAPLPSISNLPYARNVDFVGRSQALHEIERSFASEKPADHVQVIYGIAGVGKVKLTRL